MNDHKPDPRPDWLDDYEDLANEELTDSSACDQVHPLVAVWYDELMAGDPPASRDAVWQALHCLTTEVLTDMPQSLAELLAEHNAEEEFADWVTEVLLVGRAFQIALDSGRLDDL